MEDRKEQLLEGIKDNRGNRLYMIKGEIRLRLKNGEDRKLGNIVSSVKDVPHLEVIRTSKHYMRVAKGWGFNHKLLTVLPREMLVFVKHARNSKNIEVISIGDILDNGKFLHFLAQGFERQIFIAQSLFKEDRIIK